MCEHTGSFCFSLLGEGIEGTFFLHRTTLTFKAMLSPPLILSYHGGFVDGGRCLSLQSHLLAPALVSWMLELQPHHEANSVATFSLTSERDLVVASLPSGGQQAPETLEPVAFPWAWSRVCKESLTCQTGKRLGAFGRCQAWPAPMRLKNMVMQLAASAA